jgi:hypothetical protein
MFALESLMLVAFLKAKDCKEWLQHAVREVDLVQCI